MQNVNCPHCGDAVGNDARFAGSVVTCPHCRRTFQMPFLQSVPAPGLLTVLALLPATGFLIGGILMVLSGDRVAGFFFTMSVVTAIPALLPGWFLLQRIRLVCGECRKAVTKRGGAFPAWFEADGMDYRCANCKMFLCGKCATSTPSYSDSLQSLKVKYKASGARLKRVIDADPEALYEKGELDPICPKCKYFLSHVGNVI